MSEQATVPVPAEEPKIEAQAVEPTTLATEETKPVEATPAVASSEEVPPVIAAEEKPAETAVAKDASVEPITSGVLGYKAPGLLKYGQPPCCDLGSSDHYIRHLKSSKRYFWLGNEPISTQHLSHYLRGTEAKIAHPVAAWSSQTGKGLLFLVKTEAEKNHPQDVLPLADATDVHKSAAQEFSFKIHGEKHTFKAANDAERNGWFVAIEEAVKEAKASKDGIRRSDGYQDTVKHLGMHHFHNETWKPAALAGGIAAGGAAATTIAAKKEEHHESATEPAEPAARVNSTRSVSSSDDAAKRDKNDAKKSRSVSRGKRASIFGSLLGKKEDKEVKKDEEKAEEKPATEGHVADAALTGGAATTVALKDKHEETQPEPVTTAAPAAPIAPIVAPETSEEIKEDAPVSPKPSKRNSFFGSFYQKVRSPTQEKKESEVAPIVPPKDEAPVLAEPVAPVINEPTEAPAMSAVKPTEPSTEAIKTEEAEIPATAATTPVVAEEKKEVKAETPKKEKESFLGNLLSKARAKSPAAGKRETKESSAVEAPAVPPKDEPVLEETKAESSLPSAAPATEHVPAPIAGDAEMSGATAVDASEVKATTPKESRRKSLFSGNMFRRPSQAIRRATDTKETEKENATTLKAEETPAETATDVAAPATAAQTAVETEGKPSETIGDVPAEAISVGQPQETHTTVSATA
ncbi:hypothetical protein ANO11243_015410 [Dothideomycetidae sp. 11243]|nr:hypothetical protein ANO11243_015410 [fungal sp. No.11243]